MPDGNQPIVPLWCERVEKCPYMDSPSFASNLYLAPDYRCAELPIAADSK